MDTEDARQKIGDFNKELKSIRASFNAMQAIIGKVPLDIKAYLVIEADDLFKELSGKVRQARTMWVKNEQN